MWQDEQRVQSVKLSTLTNTGAWIFPPARIQVFVAGEDALYRMVQEMSLPAPGDGLYPEEGRHTYIITFPPERCTRIRVEAIPWGALPSRHPGAGAQAWLFVDEIAFE
jgi:hexosaminidase